MTAALFDPITVGALPLQHRVVLAPMTRLRADPDDSPSAMMADYYRQRASPGGLLITESVHPSVDSRGYLGAPGLYTDRHVQQWTSIVEAVHDAGATIIVQIAHDGRQSHSDLSAGRPPIAPSVVPFDTQVVTQDGWVPNSANRELDTDEIPALLKTFGEAARRALAAGFDGIELHAANGYLVNTFLQDGTNRRTDRYGGSIAARARFPLEVTAALVDVFGAERVGVRMSPSGTETIADGAAPVAAALLRKHFGGAIIAAGGFDGAGAAAIIERGDADLVAFGRWFSSNPDLPARLRHHWPLEPYDRSAFWGGTEYHYCDYLPYDGHRNA